MSSLKAALFFFLLVVGAGAAVRARADAMDPALSRLGVVSATDRRPCSADGTNLLAGVSECSADDPSFQRLSLALGNAIAAPILGPASTVGYRHFQVSADVSHTDLGFLPRAQAPGADGDDDATRQEWAAFRDANALGLATSGAPVEAGQESARYRSGNRSISSGLTLVRLAFRKGLPLGIELGGSVGRVIDTTLWAFSFEAKWSLLEGFRRRWPAAFPDFAVRGSVSSLVGLRGFSLTVPTFDLLASKRFVVGHTLKVTPFVAGQAVWILADSQVVDVTPGNLADNASGASLVSFDSVRAWHPRIVAGLEVGYRRLRVVGAYRRDLGDPARGMSIAGTAQRRWSVDVGLGVVY